MLGYGLRPNPTYNSSGSAISALRRRHRALSGGSFAGAAGPGNRRGGVGARFACASVHRPLQPSSLPRSEDGACIYRAPSYGRLLYAPVSPAFPFWLARAIREFQPDLLHLHLPNTSAFGALLVPAARRLPWVIHWHADMVSSERPRAPTRAGSGWHGGAAGTVRHRTGGGGDQGFVSPVDDWWTALSDRLADGFKGGWNTAMTQNSSAGTKCRNTRLMLVYCSAHT